MFLISCDIRNNFMQYLEVKFTLLVYFIILLFKAIKIKYYLFHNY